MLIQVQGQKKGTGKEMNKKGKALLVVHLFLLQSW